MAKMSEPSDDEAAMLGEIGREVVTIRQPRVDDSEVVCDGTYQTKGSREDCVVWAIGLMVCFSLSYLPLLEIRDHDSPNDRKATRNDARTRHNTTNSIYQPQT